MLLNNVFLKLTHVSRSSEDGSALASLVFALTTKAHIRKTPVPVGRQKTGIKVEMEFSDESIMANRRQLGSHALENCMEAHEME